MEKQTGINLIAQVIAFGINLGISFFLTPFIVEKIGVEANGFVSLANNFVEYAQLITISINSMAGRFITIKLHQKNPEDANKYFSSVFIANLIFSVVLTILSIVLITFIDRFMNISTAILTDVRILWAFIFGNFILGLFTSTFNVSTFVKDRLDLNAFCNIKGYIIRIIILLVCYIAFDIHVWYIGLALFCMGLYNLIKNINYAKTLTPELRISKNNFNVKAIVELLKSGIWNTISKLSSILSSGLDLLITNIFISATAMGILSLAKTIPTIILSLFGTIAAIFAPSLTISYAKGDSIEIKHQLNSSIKILGILSSIPLAILIGFGKEFYSLWAPTQDSSLLYILTLINCANLIFALPLEPLYNVFTATNKIKTSSLALISFSTLSLATTFVLLKLVPDDTNLKMFVILGVSSFYNIVRVLTFLPMYGAKCLNFKLNTFYGPIIKNTISVIILSIIGLAIKYIININSWIMLIFSCILIALLGLIINSTIILDKTERRDFYNKLKERLKGLKNNATNS